MNADILVLGSSVISLDPAYPKYGLLYTTFIIIVWVLWFYAELSQIKNM
jgi:hypothetical protein